MPTTPLPQDMVLLAAMVAVGLAALGVPAIAAVRCCRRGTRPGVRSWLGMLMASVLLMLIALTAHVANDAVGYARAADHAAAQGMTLTGRDGDVDVYLGRADAQGFAPAVRVRRAIVWRWAYPIVGAGALAAACIIFFLPTRVLPARPEAEADA